MLTSSKAQSDNQPDESPTDPTPPSNTRPEPQDGDQPSPAGHPTPSPEPPPVQNNDWMPPYPPIPLSGPLCPSDSPDSGIPKEPSDDAGLERDNTLSHTLDYAAKVGDLLNKSGEGNLFTHTLSAAGEVNDVETQADTPAGKTAEGASKLAADLAADHLAELAAAAVRNLIAERIAAEALSKSAAIGSKSVPLAVGLAVGYLLSTVAEKAINAIQESSHPQAPPWLHPTDVQALVKLHAAPTELEYYRATSPVMEPRQDQ